MLVLEPHGADRDPVEMQGHVPGEDQQELVLGLNFNEEMPSFGDWFSLNSLELATLGSSQK